MPIRPTHVGLLAVSLVLARGQAPLPAQEAGPWSGCRTDSLSTYNCAQYYNGTVSRTAELKTADGTETLSIVATVTAGRVSCRIKEGDGPEFEGPGMLAVEHGGTGNSGRYIIRVWCPGAEGERPTRADSPVIDTYEQRSADYAALEGKDAHEHPDADPVNGVSGTETIAWRLTRR